MLSALIHWFLKELVAPEPTPLLALDAEVWEVRDRVLPDGTAATEVRFVAHARTPHEALAAAQTDVLFNGPGVYHCATRAGNPLCVLAVDERGGWKQLKEE